jgi:hypothetical protein
MEYMEDNLEEWLGEELEGYGEEDYLVFDCPGKNISYLWSCFASSNCRKKGKKVEREAGGGALLHRNGLRWSFSVPIWLWVC